MAKKLGEYFSAGVQVVWIVNPRKRTVQVYTAVHRSVVFTESETLDGGDVLPGFVLRLKELFPPDQP